VAHGPGLGLDVRHEGGVIPLQPLLDERAQDDLKAYRELESGRGPSRMGSGPIQNLLGKDEENSGLVREHAGSLPLVYI
jgi:hypothetical protein